MTETNEKIFDILCKMHPNAKCELDYTTPFELLIAVVLSAQCTDKRVNKVTSELFKIANTPEAFAAMDLEELEKHIFSCGFYHNKAKAIKSISLSVLEAGGMPSTRDELEKLHGVGRKTANVVYSEAYGGNAIAVDTHVFRVSNRLGLVDAPDVLKTEMQLRALIPQDRWSDAHHWLIFHGRRVCKAQHPLCGECTLRPWCRKYNSETE